MLGIRSLVALAAAAAGLVSGAAALASCWMMHGGHAAVVTVHEHALLGQPAVAFGALAGVAAAGVGTVAALGVASRTSTKRALARQQAEHVRYLKDLASELRHPLSTMVMSLEVLHPDSGVDDGERGEVTAIVDRQLRRLDDVVVRLSEIVKTT